jgi:gluconolactonase
MLSLDIADPRLLDVVSEQAKMEYLAQDLGITEGVAWHRQGSFLVFSDLSAGRVYRWREADGLGILRTPSNITNGNCVDREGRIVSCEHASSSVVRFEPEGRHISVLASRFQGKELNSPNDVICDSQGRLWFTDPVYGRTNPRVGVLREPEIGFQGVYRIETDGRLVLIADDFSSPNGLCLTPAEDTLLVDDTDRHHIRSFSVSRDGKVRGGQVLASIASDDTGKPDGMKCDAQGRIYCTGAGGVHVLAPGGQLLGVIRTPTKARNLCFGGPQGSIMFLAIDRAILRLPMKARGA